MRKMYGIWMVVIILVLSSCSMNAAHPKDERPVETDVSAEIQREEDVDIIYIDDLSGIDVAEWEVNDESILYRNNMEVDFRSVIFQEPVTYYVEDENIPSYIEVSKVVLEPIKLTADFSTEGSVEIEPDVYGTIGLKKMSDSFYETVSKYIPVNVELELRVDHSFEITLPKEKKFSLWFYPICYKIIYNQEEYRILKMANRLSDAGVIHPVVDGILEIRVSDIDESDR